MIVVGILFGLIAAGGAAFLICSIILLKSNDFGNTQTDIDRYTGYSPVNIVNEGQVNGPNSSRGAYTPKRFF
ncbi:MAG: hypothetical protein IKO32_12230 [Lachnospiraceae bacterium]|nr:hypothetical protein [Lachnospiraceae bacterium]